MQGAPCESRAFKAIVRQDNGGHIYIIHYLSDLRKPAVERNSVLQGEVEAVDNSRGFESKKLFLPFFSEINLRFLWNKIECQLSD